MRTVKVLLCIVLVLVLVICGMLAYLHFQKKDISDWEEHYNLGVRYLSDGNYEEAILAFSAAIEIAPNRPEAYIARGDAYFGLGDYEAAQRDYEVALDLAPAQESDIADKLEKVQILINEGTAVETTAADPETEAPVMKHLTNVSTYINGSLDQEVRYIYNDSNLLTRTTTVNYNSGQILSSWNRDFVYDGSGNLIQESDSVSPYIEYTYVYDNGIMVGYHYNEIMGDIIAFSVDYHFERDNNGNIVKITSTSDEEDVWMDASYTYNDAGQRISAYEHERYGDYEFERNYGYDHSYPGIVIVNKEESLFGYVTASRYIQISDFEKQIVGRYTLYEGYSLVTDEDGYVTAVNDETGATVYTFTYEEGADVVTEAATLAFSAIPSKYTFTSGAGGWATGLTIAADGTFTGAYSDSDMGDIGEGYSRGTSYYCNFSGKFSAPVQVNDYTYVMTLEFFETQDPEGIQYIENDIRYISSGPYGFDGPTEYYLYLPGIPRTMMPQDCFEWINRLSGGDMGTDEWYVICSANGELPFVGRFD